MYSFIKLLSLCSRTRTRLYQIEVPLERTTYEVEFPSKKTTWGFNEDWIFQVDFSGLKDLFVCDRDAQRSSVNLAGYLIEGLDKVASFLGVLLWGPSAPRPTLWEELHAHIRGTPLPQHGGLWREMWFGKPPVKTKTSLWEIISDHLWEASGPKPGHFRLNTLSCSLQDFPSYLRDLRSGLYDLVDPVIVTVAHNLNRIIDQVGGKLYTFVTNILHLSSHFCSASFLSGVPDLWDHNKILSGIDLSHYQVRHCIFLEFSFILFDLCLFITIFNFIMNYVLIVTFWIFTYHKIWFLLIICCFIWNYWIIYFLTWKCFGVLWVNWCQFAVDEDGLG